MSMESQTSSSADKKGKLFYNILPIVAGVFFSVALMFVIQSTGSLFPVTSNSDTNPKIKIETDLGIILIELYPEHAASVVSELIALSKSGYYNDNTVMESMAPFGFVIAKTGASAKTFKLKVRPNKLPSLRGSVAISKLKEPKAYLNNLFVGYQADAKFKEDYVIIGQVLEGLETIEKSQNGVSFKVKSFESL